MNAIHMIKDFIKKNKLKIILPILAALALFLFLRLVVFNSEKTVKPKSGPIIEAVYALGTVKPENVFTLKMGVYTGLRKLYVQEGDTIARGAPLLLTDSGVIFSAPFAGTITSLMYKEDETILPGGPVLTMMDLKHTYVLLSLDQESALRVRRGQKAQLSFESIRGQKLTGVVDKIYPSNAQFLVRIAVHDIPEGILPEMTADVAIEVAQRENALLVPMAAVKRGIVTIIRSGHREKKEVKIGAINGEWGEVLDDGIKIDDELVLPKEGN